MYLLDTDILSNLMRRAPSTTLIAKLASVPPEQQFTSSITLGELIYGACRLRARTHILLEQLEGILLPNLPVLPFDAAAARLTHEMERAGVKANGLVADGSRPTTIKSRVVAGSQHVVRFDRESDAPLARAVRERVIQQIRERLPEADVLLISDYAKGVVGASLVREVLALAARLKKPVTVDPKVQHVTLFRGATVIAPNHHEAAAAARILVRDEADFLRVGQRLLARLKARAVLITRGEQGMSLFEVGRAVTHIPTFAREVYDVTGAGDTVMAVLTLALAAGAPMRDAAVLANYGAGVVVGKRGTATVNRGELVRAIRDGKA